MNGNFSSVTNFIWNVADLLAQSRWRIRFTAISLSGIWRIKFMGSLLSEIAAMKRIHLRVAEWNKKWPHGFIK